MAVASYLVFLIACYYQLPPQVLIQHTLHTINSIPDSTYELLIKPNMSTTTEVMQITTMDLLPKLHALGGSGSLLPVHVTSNYHTATGPMHTTYVHRSLQAH